MEYEIQENCLIIFLPAELDHHTAEIIRRKADDLIQNKRIKYVVFDFQKTDFMDSSGIGVILGRYRMVGLLGGSVWATHVNDRMRKILTMSGVTKIVKLYEEEEA